jgi:glycosyltransferase involved in cell wall biosynthesis
MRVIYVSSIARGGPLSHLLDLAPYVAEAGADVTVLCSSEDVARVFRRAGVQARATPLRHMLDLVGGARVHRELRGADIVHTHDRRAGLLARPAARLRGAVAVHTLHGLPEGFESYVGRDDLRLPAGPARLRLAAEAALSRLGTTVTPSAAMARILIRNGFPRQRLRVIPHGIVVRRPEPPPPRSPVVVGTAANLERFKGVDVLIDACGQIGSPVVLEVFGDGSLRTELERQAARCGVDARFHGWVPNLRRRLEDIDIFVLPTRGDNLPMSILEAMALALPVVSTRVGGVPELVADGETGILVSPGDPRELGAAIARLVADPDLRAAFGRAGAQRVAECFDVRKVAGQLIELYRELAAER